MRDKDTGNKKGKTVLVLDGMIVYLENPRESMKNYYNRKRAQEESHTQKSVVFYRQMLSNLKIHGVKNSFALAITNAL